MNPFLAPDLGPALPEIFLVFMSLILLLAGVSQRKENFGRVSNFSLLALIVTGIVVCSSFGLSTTTFSGMFIVDDFASFMKLLVIAGAAATSLMSVKYAESQRIACFEYPVLMMFSTLGMMLMISANDLISLYMAIELQSLPLYVLASLQRDNMRSTEAGLKYFVLGALSSGMLLYGASLIYGYTGATNFDMIMLSLAAEMGQLPLGLVVGIVLLLSGLAFKVSAVPFHMWTPDVYEGTPTPVTAFFAIAPKIAALALIARVLFGALVGVAEVWQQIIIILSVGSMLWGAVAAIAQRNIKRMLAYSSIGHMGYALIGFAAAGTLGVQAVMIYAALYVATAIGTFAVVLMMKRKERMVENISDLAGLAQSQPLLALAMSIMMFSMAGIPPLAGFFGKLFIFQAAMDAGLYKLAVVGVLASVISAFYYLRVIKVMYFDEAVEEALDLSKDGRLNFALVVSAIVVIFFIVMPAPLLTAAETAALTLVIR